MLLLLSDTLLFEFLMLGCVVAPFVLSLLVLAREFVFNKTDIKTMTKAA
jgi:hypothetical protein